MMQNDFAAGIEPLPVYGDAQLATMDVSQLIELLVRDEDRVPRNVIDECARRGAAMRDALTPVVGAGAIWGEYDSPGHWWLRLHAIFILGLMEEAAAGELLTQAMHGIFAEEEYDLQDWLAGYWPALFRNKPETVLPAIEALSRDDCLDAYIRVQALEVILEAASCRGREALDARLAETARWLSDPSQDAHLRMMMGSVLLDFPRDGYRALLQSMADEQSGRVRYFGTEEIDKAYSAGVDTPQWNRFTDPWEFYAPEKIRARQERWAEEDAAFHDDRFDIGDEAFLPELPYVRETPKVGRNDPCPCGSGRKYKKCCLLNERGT